MRGSGSSGNGDSTAIATISKAKFDKRMEALCEHSEEKKFEEIGIRGPRRDVAQAHREPSKEDLEVLTSVAVVPVFKRMTEEMRETPLPKGSEKKTEAMIATFEGDVRGMEKEPSRFVEGVAFQDGNNTAEAMGLGQCSFSRRS